MKTLTLLFSLLALSFNAAYAASSGLLTDTSGRVLYTFDKDAAGKSNCNGGCLAAWPAYSPKSGETVTAPFSVIARDDGTTQIALNGKPLYYFAGDSKAGEANGDGQGGVWHVVRQGAEKRSAAETRTESSYGYHY